MKVLAGTCTTVRAFSVTAPRHGVLVRVANRKASAPDRLKFRIRAEKEVKDKPKKNVDDEEEPIWVRREKQRELASRTAGDLPFGVYLLASVIVAIAAVGSIFEYTNKNPIFSVIPPESFLYTPILGLFALTGFPTSAYLFYKAVTSANKLSEEMDKMDGYK